jgi:cohesin loading factor subunit SCC2
VHLVDKKEMVTFDDEPKKGSRKSLRDDPQEVLGALSIHLLGLIAARLRQDIILVEQGAIFFAPPPRKLIEGSSEQEDFSCLCGTGNGQGFMLDCDDCHRWFHGECVGINPSAVPATWYCDQCLLRRQLQEHKQSIIERDEAILKGVCQDKLASILLSPTRQKRKIADDLTFDTHLDEINRQEVKGDLCSQGMTTANKDDSHTPVIKQLILNYLLHKSKVDPAALYARQFFLAQWNYEDDNDNAEYYRAQWSFTNEKSFAIHGAPSLSHDGTRKILVHLVATRELLKSFPRLLNEILCVLNESSTRYRTRAIRALSLIVESDPNILGWPKVQASVKGRLYDQAISVREAAVDLVGRYILYRPDFARHYFDYLAERFEDVGLSVRKRVVKIAQSICWLEPSSPLTSSILVHLSKRMNDEDVVKELVMKTFKNLWFTNDQRKMWKGELSEPLIVDHTTKEQNNGANSYDIRVKVKQILEVISCDNAGNNEWFVELVQGLLKRKENDEPKCNKDIYHICEQMCDCLMELLLQIDEGVPSSSSTKVPSLKSATLSNNVEENGPSKLGSIFTLLNLFCKVSPQLLVSHAETLQPYLKSQREEDAHIHQEIASILEKVVPLIEPPDYQFMQSLMSDLQSLVNTSLTPVVQSCMKSICTIAKFSRNFILPKQMYNNFFNFLEALKPEMKMVSKQKIFAIRSLYALGLLCKYFDFDQDAARNQLLATNKKITYGTHIEKLYEMYTKYWNHEDLELKIAALKGLGCIMASYPGLFLRAEPILSEALSLTSSTRLKMAAIKIFSEFLDFEEQKMEELGEKNAMRTTKERNEVKENADYGVTAAIIQKHLKPILEHMFDRDINVRLQALNLVYQIVRRSLIHPIQCVPHLIALETERNIALSEKAHRTLRVIEEKHPTMIHNRISEGLLLSYTFQTKIFGSGRAIRVTQTKEGQSLKESSLGRFYSLCAGSKTGRNAFLSSVIHLFETNESNEQFLKYLTLATAALPFTLQDEPLYLIYHINRVTSFRGAQLLVSLKEKIKHLDEIGTKNEELSKECKAMVSVILLLRLKKFLKCFYGLSNSKIHQFLPQDSKLGLLNSKVPIEAADFKTLLNIEDLKEGNWECNSKLCEQVFNIFKQELKNDEFNHNALPYYSSTKRGGSGTRKRRATLSKQVDENGGSVPKTKRPLKRRRLSQNDDPDADYVPL